MKNRVMIRSLMVFFLAVIAGSADGMIRLCVGSTVRQQAQCS